MVSNRNRSLLIALLTAALLVPASLAPTAAAASRAHIAIIIEENRNLNQVIGASDMPYLNSLASTYSSFTHWNGVAHPSEPNYIALIAGSTMGVVDDGHYDFGNANNLGAQLTAAGVSWKAYMENIPATGSLVDVSGQYVRKHNPFADFNGNAANFVPATQYAQDLAAGTLPDFIFYVPNLINDGHDAANPTVDASLRSIIEPLRTNAWYTQNAGSIVVTYDEDEGQGAIAHVVVSEAARSHATFSGNHYGTLRTIEESYGLPLLGAAASGTSFRSILGGSAPSPTPTPTPTPGATFQIQTSLDASSFQTGGTMSGHVTVTSSADATISRVVLAARPPGGTNGGGPYLDIGGASGIALRAGVPTTVSASRAVTTSDPLGSWYAFGTIQKSDGSWQDGASVAFSLASSAPPPVPTPTPTPTPSGGAQVAIADVNGNNWWVQAHVTGADAALVNKLEAQVGSGAWTNLPKQSFGDWAASFYVPTGSALIMRATLSDGRTATSCVFTHPAGSCANPSPPVPVGGAFAATFTNMRGNAWWVEVNVAATSGTLAGVDASVNGGAWIPLPKTSWGSYAKSINAPAGSQVTFRADGVGGATALSSPKTW